jgi:hypothetical protein
VLHARKKPTVYGLVDDGSGVALCAHATASASGLMTRMRRDPAATPKLTWRWKIQSLVEGADLSNRKADDAPVRLIAAFDGDVASLPIPEQMFFERVKLFTGRDLPYATLMYVWDNRLPLESIVENAYSRRVRQLVVASGPNGVGQWQHLQRNLVDDFRRVFGEAPGPLVGLGLMTDSDNTAGEVSACYGDLVLSP